MCGPLRSDSAELGRSNAAPLQLRRGDSGARGGKGLRGLNEGSELRRDGTKVFEVPGVDDLGFGFGGAREQ